MNALMGTWFCEIGGGHFCSSPARYADDYDRDANGAIPGLCDGGH